MKKKPELLVPLNDWKSLYKEGNVLDHGDAFYFGLQGDANSFNMRTRAGNFKVESLGNLIETIHDKNKKLYLCTNVIIYDEEVEHLKCSIAKAQELGVDAIICHDIAAITVAKELNMPFHVSTQANISNVLSASFYEKLGAERIILARELNLNQISEIINNTLVQIEVFVHGAMCTAISGRCYFSAELMYNNEHYSANRGKCIQPCRRMWTFRGEEDEEIKYDLGTGMFFNAKDLCLIEHIDKLIEAGIHSFKIEGRMRDPRYIATTAKCYREAIDSYYSRNYTKSKIEKWKDQLTEVFNRGFHTGFMFSIPNSHDIEKSIRGNVSRTHRQKIGHVKNYFRKVNAVEVEMTQGKLSIGDHMIFENKGDFYCEMDITSMQKDNESIIETETASSDNHIIIGLKIGKPVPKNCAVYQLIKK